MIQEVKRIIKSEKLDIDMNLSDELLIQEFEEKVNWVNICKNRKLSENFILKFRHCIDWFNILKLQKLTENFIEVYFVNKSNIIRLDFLNSRELDFIAVYQILSEKFILKHWSIFDHKWVIRNQKSLTLDFLLWLYKTNQMEEYLLLRERDENFMDYSIMIEDQIPLVLIEFNDPIITTLNY